MGIKNPYWRNVVICLDYIVQTPGFHFSATPQLGADCVCNSDSPTWCRLRLQFCRLR